MEKLVYGSAFLGGGGGGDLRIGLEIGRRIIDLGGVRILPIEQIDQETLLITLSVVGPQSIETWSSSRLLANLIRVVRLLERFLGEEIGGLISSEIGAVNTLAPFPASVALDIPVVDAPCNGRAHPTVLMGSMGLHRLPSYRTVLAASWQTREEEIGEAILRGSLEEVVSILRSIVSVRGSVATARNPIKASYVARNGAPGSVKLALEIGDIFHRYRHEPEEISHKLLERYRGFLVSNCLAIDKFSEIRENLDYGVIYAKCGDKNYTLTYANEYMYLESSEGVVSVFPDLISTIDPVTGTPLLSKDIKTGMKFDIIVISRENLKLGSGVKYPESYEQVNKALGRDLRMYLKDLLIT